jgi:dihydrofolate reductase
MGKVVVCLSVSLDGYIAGPGDGMDSPMGEGGEALFAWMNAGPERNRRDRFLCPPDASVPVVEAWVHDAGAGVSGRRTFDIARGWADGHPIDAPNFVVTHHPPTEGRWHPQVRFVADGIDRAVDLALEAARDKDVAVCAASPVQQLLRMRRLDEIEVSIAPVLLGGGVRLFDEIEAVAPVRLEQLWAIPSDGVTHIRYRVVR